MKSFLKTQWLALLSSIAFFTIIPIRNSATRAAPNHLLRYFSLTGGIIALVSTGAYLISSYWWSPCIAVLMAMIASIILTGGLHEDGFADTCDGLLGGWHREQQLNIMKDSRLGSFGVIGLFFLMLLKWQLLCTAKPANILCFFLMGHMVSRAMACWITCRSQHANPKHQTSKQTPYTTKDLIINTIIGLTPFLFFDPIFWLALLYLIPILCMVVLLLRRWFIKKIEGYTGDLIGATQQILELVIYLTIIGVTR